MTHTVILRFDGITRHYACESYFDAIILHDALTGRFSADSVELWKGAERLM